MLNKTHNKVLIVDDDPSRRRMIRADLTSANYWLIDANRLNETDPIWASDDKNVPSVYKLIASHFFHAAIVDLSLKEVDPHDRTGFEVLKLINKLRESTKSIVLTGYGITDDVRNAWKDYEAFDYLEKGNLTRENFLMKVESAVKDARLRISAKTDSNLTYSVLVGNPTLKEAQERLEGSGEVIRSIVEEALRPWYPYDTHYKTSFFDTLHVNEILHPILVAQLWSRYLGGCIELRLGSREACEFLVEVNRRIPEKKEGVDFMEYILDPNDKISAVVEYNPSINLDELGDIKVLTE